MNALSLGVALLLLASSPRREVLVYIANEPAPTPREAENAHRIAGWLQESDQENDKILALGIEEDLRLFPEIVDADIAAIERNSRRLAGVVVASNRLLQSGVVLVGRGDGLERVPIAVAAAKDGREASNPISKAANVRSVLRLAAAQFAPADYDFVVVVESHGDELYAVTPRLGLPTEGLTQQALMERVHGSDNSFVDRYGITTSSLVSIVADERRATGFRTSLLVLASCESTIEELPPELPSALVAANGQALPYGSITFERVLTSAQPTLKGAFIAELTPGIFEVADPAAVVRRRWVAQRDRVLRTLPYFIPLAGWFGAFAWFRRSRRRRAAHAS